MRELGPNAGGKAEGKDGEGEQAARTKGLWGGVLNSAASHSQRSSLVNSSGKPLPPAEQARDRYTTVTISAEQARDRYMTVTISGKPLPPTEPARIIGMMPVVTTTIGVSSLLSLLALSLPL